MTDCRSSGSMRTESAVKPTRSAKITVTRRRSTAFSGTSTGGASGAALGCRAAIASSGLRRWPTAPTPRSFKSSEVRPLRTVSSISFSRKAASYRSRPRLRSQLAMSMIAARFPRRIVVQSQQRVQQTVIIRRLLLLGYAFAEFGMIRNEPRRERSLAVGNQDRVEIELAIGRRDVVRTVSVLRIKYVCAAHVGSRDFAMLAAKAGQPQAILQEEIIRYRPPPSPSNQMFQQATKPHAGTHVDLGIGEYVARELPERLRRVLGVPVGDDASVEIAQPQVRQQLTLVNRFPEQLRAGERRHEGEEKRMVQDVGIQDRAQLAFHLGDLRHPRIE